MEDKLDLIILQNWILLGLMVYFLLVGIFRHWKSAKQIIRHHKSDRLELLWEQNEIDVLLIESQAILDKYPNNFDALYYGGKALYKSGNLKEAKAYFIKLGNLEVSLKNEMKTAIEVIDENTANKPLNKDATDVAPIS